jgi:cytochrome c oxidase subunit 2
MTMPEPKKSRRVLIASSHALFGQGLRRLLQERQGAGVEIVGMVSDLEQAMQALERLDPDLVIVDYDDQALNREEFLARFVEGEKKLRVVLLSLHSPKEAIVYDRRTMAASQIDDWLDEWNYSEEIHILPETTQSAGIKADNRRRSMKHLIIAGILVVVVTALLIVGLQFVKLLPEQASAQAVPIDNLFHLEFMVIAFLFSLIVVFMLYSIVVFRRRKGDLSDAAHVEGNTRLEVIWTIAPLATVLFFAYLGGDALAETVRPKPQALKVNVIGLQWTWRFEYPELGFTSDELRLPVDRQAVLRLWSEDVIHSFWVPEFRVKQDALPGGKENSRDLRVEPTVLGDYKLRCAELCGTNHATMMADVRVVSKDDFDAWVREKTFVSDDPVVRGEQWARQFGCFACHSVDGSKVNESGITYLGPTWQGIFGEQTTMADGTTVTVDEAYLLESIVDPGAKIVAGYPPGIMPANFADQLTEEQIQDIIAYIVSLR